MSPKTACLLLLFLGTACAAPSTQVVHPTHTLDPIQVYVDADASQGTAISAIATAGYFSIQLTATAKAEEQTATQQAMQNQSQATERAWLATTTADSIRSTTVASGTASAVAQQAAWTQRAVDITSTADIASVQAFATEQFGIARTSELALKRRELMNSVAAITPWAVFFITFAAIILFFKRWTRVRVIPRDRRGDAPLLLDIVDGVAYDADRSPVSTAGLQRDDLKRLPQFSAKDHTETTARDQMAAHPAQGLPPSNQKKGFSKQIKEPASAKDETLPKIETIDANSARPLFKDIIPYIVQDAIDAEIVSEEET